MKSILIALLLFGYWFMAMAHPGIGLVYDGQNTIYYTDLTHIWKLDIRTGKPEIAIENVHSHELALDKNGNLYGENYWYVASEQQFKNYLWKLDAEGGFKRISEDKPGENLEFSFVRDSDFAGYYVNKKNDHYEIVRKDSITQKVWHVLKLSNPGWKYLNAQGQLLITDYPSIYRIDADKVTLLIENVASHRFPFSIQGKEHNLYGLWTDASNRTYVAVYGGRVVKMISPDGLVSIAVKSPFLWSPVNGVFDSNNDLWLMESRLDGQIRLRKIDADQIFKDTSFTLENIILFSLVVILFGLLILVIGLRKGSINNHR